MNPPSETISLQLPFREWAYIHTELEWIRESPVALANRKRSVELHHAGYTAWLLRKGSVQVQTESENAYEAHAGQWLLLPPENRYQHFSEDAVLLSLRFRCHWPSGEPLLMTHQGLVLEATEVPELEILATELAGHLLQFQDDGVTHLFSRRCHFRKFLEMQTLFLNWMDQWIAVQAAAGIGISRLSPNDDRLLRAVRCLNSAPLNSPLPHGELEAVSGLSEAHLNRLFFAEFGQTLRKSWDDRRLHFARNCLESSQMPIKEIAYSLGFKSDSHFVKWFRLRTRKRPLEYRKEHRSIS